MNIPHTSDALVESVYEFNRLGGKVPPGRFDAERVGFYIGMMLEEQAETLKCIGEAHLVHSDRSPVLELAKAMQAVGMEFKSGKHYGAVLRADRAELLDGPIDTVVVALGAAMYQTNAFRQAIEEVLRANADKGPDGVFTRDANGKIMKPTGWVGPDLTPFIDHYGED